LYLHHGVPLSIISVRFFCLKNGIKELSFEKALSEKLFQFIRVRVRYHIQVLFVKEGGEAVSAPRLFW